MVVVFDTVNGAIQPEDMAALVWLVTTLPPRAIVEDVVEPLTRRA